MDKKTTIVIVHWNTPHTLEKQLSGLTQYQDNLNIVVVDNASDKSVSWIKKRFSSITVIENKINRGFGSACNQGTLKREGEWFLFLNPDVEITPTQIRQLIHDSEKKGYDAACPESEKKDYHKPIPSPLSLLAEFTPLGRLLPLKLYPLKTLFGGCLLIKKKVFQALSGFDERFFLWFEDSDISCRLLKNKYSIGTIPLIISHEGGASFKNLADQYKRDIFFHSMYIYAKKHFCFFGIFIIWLIKKKYSLRKILPTISNHTSLTIANMKESLLKNFFSQNKNCLSEIQELIVVSNAITNENVWKWRRSYLEVRFIPIEKNRGFASTANIGLNVSTGSWIGTINDDVILQKNWIKECLSCGGNNVGSLNPVIYKKDHTVESAGISILKKGKAVPHTVLLQKVSCFSTDASNGAAVLYQKNALNKVGLFDERFGSYLEDIDLSLRLKRNGFLNMVALHSKIIHYGQSTSQTMGWEKNLLDARNWIYVIAKNWKLSDFLLHGHSILLERIRNLYGIVKAFKKNKGVL